MAKEKIRQYSCKRESVKDGRKYIVYVYGEMEELPYLSGIASVLFTPKGRIVRHVSAPVPDYGSEQHSNAREFNMGWALCTPEDIFDEVEAVNIAKRRFSMSPLTTQNGCWLNDDMCQSIVDNEAKYIAEHLDHFIGFFSRNKK